MQQQDIRNFFKPKPQTADNGNVSTQEEEGTSKDTKPAVKEPSRKEIKKKLKQLEQKCIVEMAGDMPPVQVFALPPMFKSTTMTTETRIFTSNDSLEEEGEGIRTTKTRGTLEIKTIDITTDENEESKEDSKEKKRKKPREWTKSTKKKDDAIHQQSRKVKALKKQIASYQFLNCKEELEKATAELDEANKKLFELWDNMNPIKSAPTVPGTQKPTPSTTTTTTNNTVINSDIKEDSTTSTTTRGAKRKVGEGNNTTTDNTNTTKKKAGGKAGGNKRKKANTETTTTTRQKRNSRRGKTKG